VAGGGYARIREAAWRGLTLSGATAPDDIDPVRVAQALDIDVVEGGIVGATERITMCGDRARIRVTDRIVLLGRRQFTIAHAIGHHVAKHVVANGGDVSGWIDVACSGRTKRDEREADVYARELLTPAQWVRAYCDLMRIDLDGVNAIASLFRVSPVMAAMRLVELSPRACAVVYSENGVVRWAKGSSRSPRLIERGTPVPAGSIAAHSLGAAIEGSHRAAARTWFPLSDRAAASGEVIEHVLRIPEPGWGGVLSLLAVDGLAERS
jgi:hypothetical protein